MKPIFTNFLQTAEPTSFRLVQGLLRCGQTPFSSFLILLSADDWLFPGGEWGWGWGMRAIRDFIVSLGVTICYSVFGFLYEKSCLFGWQATGEDCSLDPPWSNADARVCKGAKIGLVWGL
jgi:hypothetical protein